MSKIGTHIRHAVTRLAVMTVIALAASCVVKFIGFSGVISNKKVQYFIAFAIFAVLFFRDTDKFISWYYKKKYIVSGSVIPITLWFAAAEILQLAGKDTVIAWLFAPVQLFRIINLLNEYSILFVWIIVLAVSVLQHCAAISEVKEKKQRAERSRREHMQGRLKRSQEKK